MTSSNTIAFGADTLDVDSVKVPGTMLLVRRALLAYEKKMQPGDHLVVCAEEVGKKGRNRVEVAVIHERADAVAAGARTWRRPAVRMPPRRKPRWRPSSPRSRMARG